MTWQNDLIGGASNALNDALSTAFGGASAAGPSAPTPDAAPQTVPQGSIVVTPAPAAFPTQYLIYGGAALAAIILVVLVARK